MRAALSFAFLLVRGSGRRVNKEEGKNSTRVLIDVSPASCPIHANFVCISINRSSLLALILNHNKTAAFTTHRAPPFPVRRFDIPFLPRQRSSSGRWHSVTRTPSSSSMLSYPLVALLVALPLTRQLGCRWLYSLVKVEAVLVLVAEPIVPHRLLPLSARDARRWSRSAATQPSVDAPGVCIEWLLSK